MGITASNLSFVEVNRRFYGRKLRFTAPLTRRRKTKFPTVKPPIYLPKCQIWMQLSPNFLTKLIYTDLRINVFSHLTNFDNISNLCLTVIARHKSTQGT